MESIALSWGNEKHRAEFTIQPGSMRLQVDRLHRVDADAEGRVLRAVVGPSTWRRSYADRYVEIRSEQVDNERFHVPCIAMPHNALSMVVRVRTMAQDARQAAVQQAAPSDVVAALDRILSWDADRLADDGDRFRRIYKSVGPLPPDQQMAIVLQPRQDFTAHVKAVLAFLGGARPMRRNVYFDGQVDPTALTPFLSVIAELVPGERVAATVPAVGEADWAELQKSGLTRVYVPLDGFIEPRWNALRQAGIALALLASPPSDLDEADLLATRLNALPLDAQDTVYVMEPQPYPFEMDRRMAFRRAFHHLRAALRYPPNPAGPIVAHYPLLQSVY